MILLALVVGLAAGWILRDLARPLTAKELREQIAELRAELAAHGDDPVV